MPDDINVVNVEAFNGGTLIRVDIEIIHDDEITPDKIFIKTKSIFKALNNYLVEQYEKGKVAKGWHKVNDDGDSENIIN